MRVYFILPIPLDPFSRCKFLAETYMYWISTPFCHLLQLHKASARISESIKSCSHPHQHTTGPRNQSQKSKSTSARSYPRSPTISHYPSPKDVNNPHLLPNKLPHRHLSTDLPNLRALPLARETRGRIHRIEKGTCKVTRGEQGEAAE